MSHLAALAARWASGRRPTLTVGDRTWTHEALVDGLRRAAGWLDDQGLRRGDRLALQLPRDPAFLFLHLAAVGRGISTVPLNPRYTPHETAWILGDAAPALAIVPDDRVDGPTDGARRVMGATVALASLAEADPGPLLDPAVDAEDEAILGYTSGTTGRPKGARFLHRNLTACVGALAEAWGMRPDDTLVHALPIFHIHGLVVAQHVALWAGASTRWLPGFDAAVVAEALGDPASTVFMGVPTFYTRLLAHPDLPDLHHLRLCTSGSAPLPAEVHEAFEARTGQRILERYGMTEVGIVLSNPLDGVRKPGSVGLPVGETEVRIVREDGTRCEPGEVGEVTVRGPSVFAGYLGRPEATAAALRDGWMHTGDLGLVDDDGYVHLRGRRTDLVLVGGFNVYPLEIETALREHPAVDDAAVVGIADADLGERVCATLVADAVPDDLDAFLRARLTPYKLPRHVAATGALPRNAMGKVRKDVLRTRWGTTEVREAGAADAERIVAWSLDLARESEDLALDPDTVRAGVAGALARPDAAYLLATRHDVVVGQLLWQTLWSDWRAGPIVILDSIYVDPAWRRCGVLRTMLDAVVRRARDEGAVGLRLAVDRNNDGARAAYASLGLVPDHQDLLVLPLAPPEPR